MVHAYHGSRYVSLKIQVTICRMNWLNLRAHELRSSCLQAYGNEIFVILDITYLSKTLPVCVVFLREGLPQTVPI